MIVTIWEQEDCPLCENAIALYKAKGIEPDVRCISKLMSGAEEHVDAMVALAMQNNVLPLVRADGVFLKPGEYV